MNNTQGKEFNNSSKNNKNKKKKKKKNEGNVKKQMTNQENIDIQIDEEIARLEKQEEEKERKGKDIEKECKAEDNTMRRNESKGKEEKGKKEHVEIGKKENVEIGKKENVEIGKKEELVMRYPIVENIHDINEFTQMDESKASKENTIDEHDKRSKDEERKDQELDEAKCKEVETFEAERKASEEESKDKEETERLEAERKTREEKERKDEEEAERLEAERKAREEKEHKDKEEAERLEAERKAHEEKEHKDKEEAERLEAERKAREEKEHKDKEEAERIAREEKERKDKEEAERLEAERKTREEKERKDEEERINAERLAQDEQVSEESQRNSSYEGEPNLLPQGYDSVSLSDIPSFNTTKINETITDVITRDELKLKEELSNIQTMKPSKGSPNMRNMPIIQDMSNIKNTSHVIIHSPVITKEKVKTSKRVTIRSPSERRTKDEEEKSASDKNTEDKVKEVEKNEEMSKERNIKGSYEGKTTCEEKTKERTTEEISGDNTKDETSYLSPKQSSLSPKQSSLSPKQSSLSPKQSSLSPTHSLPPNPSSPPLDHDLIHSILHQHKLDVLSTVKDILDEESAKLRKDVHSTLKLYTKNEKKSQKPDSSWNWKMVAVSFLASLTFILLISSPLMIPQQDGSNIVFHFPSILSYFFQPSQLPNSYPIHDPNEPRPIHVPIVFHDIFSYKEEALQYLNHHVLNQDQFRFAPAYLPIPESFNASFTIFILEEFHKGRNLASLRGEIEQVRATTHKEVVIIVYRYGEYPTALGPLYHDKSQVYEILHVGGTPNPEGLSRTNNQMKEFYEYIKKKEI